MRTGHLEEATHPPGTGPYTSKGLGSVLGGMAPQQPVQIWGTRRRGLEASILVPEYRRPALASPAADREVKSVKGQSPSGTHREPGDPLRGRPSKITCPGPLSAFPSPAAPSQCVWLSMPHATGGPRARDSHISFLLPQALAPRRDPSHVC